MALLALDPHRSRPDRCSPPFFRALHALAVDDAGRRARCTIHGFPALHIERVMNAIQRAIPVPKVEITKQRAFRRQVFGNITPSPLMNSALRTERAKLLDEGLAGLITPTCNDHAGALRGEDVRKEDDVRALVDKTVARFGRLDVAVNNAGTEGQVGPITEQTAESYAATFDTNVLGVILSMKHEVRVMQGQGSGSIINISSTYGHEAAAGASIYVGSKHAVEGITKSVALEIAKSGIRVNGVAPGPTDTGMLTRFTGTPEIKAALVTGVPMGRLGLSEELANAIVFIASDEASFITGHVLNVEGGHHARWMPLPV